MIEETDKRLEKPCDNMIFEVIASPELLVSCDITEETCCVCGVGHCPLERNDDKNEELIKKIKELLKKANLEHLRVCYLR
jgi:hypothetical protein